MIDKILRIIQEIEINPIVKKPNNVEITGFSGDKILGILQKFVESFSTDTNACYLEIGVFQGLTLCLSSLVCPTFPCYGVDNFAFFDPENKNFDLVKERIKKLVLNNVEVINKDYEDAMENLQEYIADKKIAVYFIDGPHDYRSQLMCLQLALPYLHDDAVIIVDDSNYRHVRQANRDFLVTHPEYKLIFEAYTKCHPKNMTPEEEKKARQGWWNGINIIVRDKKNKLSFMYPPTERSRQLYENEHIVHSSQLAEFAPNAINILNYLYNKNFLIFILYGLKMSFKINQNKNIKNRYKSMNTYSEDLQKDNFAS